MGSWLLIGSLLFMQPLGAGDHRRTVEVDGQDRSYLIHIPDSLDLTKPVPVVLILHGAGMNGRMMIPFCGMNKKADAAGFVAVYPNGTGTGIFLTFNAGGVTGRKADGRPDDVRFIGSLLDDLSTVVRVDAKRVFATGMSNGGMMCYRLAAELAGRIAAIAPVSGTMAMDVAQPSRPVPIMHFHGTADGMVSFDGPNDGTPKFISFKSVPQTIQIWTKINGCRTEPIVEDLPDRFEDGTNVTKKTFSAGAGGAEVVLIEIDGGGHTWPGVPSPLGLIGKSTADISANDMMWEFFQRHPLP